ncbi:hypothetical protein HMPREF3192_00136 [Atopobium deltae]|uniref:Uncharacterized protein n=1 Tax=Atopobium deltae TaxID=1393034 RepID=A0A133XX07_9ACTN|nr:hypothetical protein HMPREF3192_00136 [Atopobium deltae]
MNDFSCFLHGKPLLKNAFCLACRTRALTPSMALTLLPAPL